MVQPRVILLAVFLSVFGACGCNMRHGSQQRATLERLSREFKIYQSTPMPSRPKLPFARDLDNIFVLLCETFVVGEGTYADIVRTLGLPWYDCMNPKGERALGYDLTSIDAGVVILDNRGRYQGHRVSYRK